jgi:hypothetical protein
MHWNLAFRQHEDSFVGKQTPFMPFVQGPLCAKGKAGGG